jgi:hypothetical protein
MILLSWLRGNKPLRVSEGSLRAIRRTQMEKALTEQAEMRKAKKLARFSLISKPQ